MPSWLKKMMKRVSFLKYFAVAAFLFLSCTSTKDMVTIQKSSGEKLKVKVEFARTDLERSKGLMFRQKLEPDEGMLFLFSHETNNGFWMKNTPLSLDILFILYGKIVDISERAIPYSESYIISRSFFTEVLEVPGGYVAGHGVRIGDKVSLP